jgi:hypothetical protein
MNDTSSTSDKPAASERSGVVAAVFTLIHSMIWLACFVVAGGITVVLRRELSEAAFPLGPQTLGYLKLANAVEASPPAILLGLSLALAVVDFSVVYALGGRSRLAEIARFLWSTAVTVIPFIALALALIALGFPFQVFAMRFANLRDEQTQVEKVLKDQLIGTWRVTSRRSTNTGEGGDRTHGESTISFSRVEGAYPDLRAESSDESILRSGDSWVSCQGSVPHLYLGEGKQVCLANRSAGNRLTLWVTPPGAELDSGLLPESVTIMTLEKRPP